MKGIRMDLGMGMGIIDDGVMDRWMAVADE